MNRCKLQLMVVWVLAALLLSACGASAVEPTLAPLTASPLPPTLAATSTPDPPTATPAPPNPTAMFTPPSPTATPIPATSVLTDALATSNLDAFNDTLVKVLSVQDGNTFHAAWVGMAVQRPDRHTVSFSGKPYIGSKQYSLAFTLKYDPSQKKHLFTIKGDLGPPLENFPLDFSESGGFVGKGTIKANGRELATEITIKKDEKGGYVWKAIFTDTDGSGRLEYNFKTVPKDSTE